MLTPQGYDYGKERYVRLPHKDMKMAKKGMYTYPTRTWRWQRKVCTLTPQGHEDGKERYVRLPPQGYDYGKERYICLPHKDMKMAKKGMYAYPTWTWRWQRKVCTLIPQGYDYGKERYICLPHKDMKMAKKTVAPLSTTVLICACEHDSESFQYGHRWSHKGHIVIFLLSQISLLDKRESKIYIHPSIENIFLFVGRDYFFNYFY